MKAPLHEQLRVASTHNFDGLFRGGLTVRHLDNLKFIQCQPELAGDRKHPIFRPDENRDDQSRLRRFERAAKRILVTGVRHGSPERFDPLSSSD